MRFRSKYQDRKRNNASSADGATDPRAAPKSQLDPKSLEVSGVKSILHGVNESPDAFPPLKSTAKTLCFILDNCKVQPPFGLLFELETLCWSQNAVVCHQRIESLAPDVQELVQLLGSPASGNRDKEQERRNTLEK